MSDSLETRFDIPISELESDKDVGLAFGISVDNPSFLPPPGLKEAGILAKVADGVIDDDVLDTLIAYQIHGVRTMLELPYGVDIKAEDVFLFASNTDVGLSLLPPSSDAPRSDWDIYSAALCLYSNLWLNRKTNRIAVMPVSNFYEYLVGRSLGYTPDSVATDPYVIHRFVDPIPVEMMDMIKADIEKVVMSHFGGEGGLRKFAHTIISAVKHAIPPCEEQPSLKES